MASGKPCRRCIMLRWMFLYCAVMSLVAGVAFTQLFL